MPSLTIFLQLINIRQTFSSHKINLLRGIMIAKNKRCRDEQRGIQGAAKMDNILRQLWNFLKENEKDMLISSSGSTPSGNNEKVRSEI